MIKDDDFDPLDSLLAEEIQPLPVGPNGTFNPQLPIQPEPIPEATKENMVCLRDCRHYVEVVSRFNAGNAKGTLEREPKQINRFCAAMGPGSEIDLTDELVTSCNRWDPILPEESLMKKFRQDRWLRNSLTASIKENAKEEDNE